MITSSGVATYPHSSSLIILLLTLWSSVTSFMLRGTSILVVFNISFDFGVLLFQPYRYCSTGLTHILINLFFQIIALWYLEILVVLLSEGELSGWYFWHLMCYSDIVNDVIYYLLHTAVLLYTASLDLLVFGYSMHWVITLHYLSYYYLILLLLFAPHHILTSSRRSCRLTSICLLLCLW